MGSGAELTRREKEVVLELVDGGRVGTIAELFGISPRTVRNHLKTAFAKLDVHSQSELIALARSEPARLGLDQAMRERSELGQEELESRCEAAIAKLIRRVDEAHARPPGLGRIRASIRAALPLDPETRREWRDWLELRSRGEAGVRSQRSVDAWRDSTAASIERLQRAGVVRADVDPADTLRTIGALTLGAGTRLLGDSSDASIDRELRMLDAFVDALGGARTATDR